MRRPVNNPPWERDNNIVESVFYVVRSKRTEKIGRPLLGNEAVKTYT
jgi:hypothetical protein